jgi:hypothetical protein
MGVLAAALFLTGLASGVHCLAMCGGFAAAFGTRRVIPIRRAAPEPGMHLALHLGRLASYAAAGALAGLLGAGAVAAGAAPARLALFVLANAMLVLVGLHLAGALAWLDRIESLGLPLWRVIRSLASRWFPPRSPAQAFVAGAAWGWLPCGLVYAALAVAAFAGSPARGAAAMLAFGAGTLPWLLAAGLAAARLRALATRRAVRIAAGAGVLGFGVFNLAHADGLSDAVRGAIAWL